MMLFFLSCSFFKERVKLISEFNNDFNLNDLLNRYKTIKSGKLELFDNNLPLSNFFNHKFNLDLVNSHFTGLNSESLHFNYHLIRKSFHLI